MICGAVIYRPVPIASTSSSTSISSMGAYDDRVGVGRTTTGNRRRNVYTQTVHYNLDGAIRPKPARVCVFAWGSARKMPEKWPPSLASVRSGREEDISTGCLSVAAEASPLPPRHITCGEAGKEKWPPNVYAPVVFFLLQLDLSSVRCGCVWATTLTTCQS